jgi:hypothetical protein
MVSSISPEIDLIKPIRPIDLVVFIGNENARPSIAHEISGLEHGSYAVSRVNSEWPTPSGSSPQTVNDIWADLS